MQVKFKGYKAGQKINISMVIPTGEQKTVITMEMPQGGDWRADMECYDKVLSAYEERLNKAMQSAPQQGTEDTEQLEEAQEAVKMGIRFKSVRQNNIIGLMMIYPDGHPRNVLMAELPMDGDWRADVDFYDEIEQAYKKRLRKALNR